MEQEIGKEEQEMAKLSPGSSLVLALTLLLIVGIIFGAFNLIWNHIRKN